MEKRKVVDKRSINLENVMKPDYIPFLGGRPERKGVIRDEDIINLRINMNTAASFEDFLNKM